MNVIRVIPELRTDLDAHRRAGKTIGFVPTMGYFHDGHRSLMRRARETTDVVVVSSFVNPAQFNDPKDLAAYPRDEERDFGIASDEGVDLVFAPAAEEIYPPGFATSVSVGGITEQLEGAFRGAGHFAGVATVVAKLFNIVAPNIAFFGQKDAQQALVIRRMVRDLDFPIRIEVCPTVREADGLAMSSRNVRLDDKARQQALALSAALLAAEKSVVDGTRDPKSVLATAREVLAHAGVSPEYLELVSADTLAPVREEIRGEALLALAAQIGGVRLIDNTILRAE
ncbi:MAG TPA: pantoate--beta-alanine ligase [Gemmatimonadaceae bacterium]|jgi:pantoate--beta-alanine ligase